MNKILWACWLWCCVYTIAYASEQCKSSQECGIDSRCVKAKGQPLGLCIKKNDSQLQVNQCATDYECDFEFACVKASGQRRGFCVKKSELQSQLPSMTEKPSTPATPKSTVKSCFANYQCDTSSKCIKPSGQQTGVCVKANDYDSTSLTNKPTNKDGKNNTSPIPHDTASRPKQCKVDIDCDIGLICDKTYKVCMKRSIK